MSDHFIGINRGVAGTKESDFTKGTSTGATNIEVRIGDAFGWTREEVRLALHRIAEQYDIPTNITASKFPPN